jgi:hypothetical protein
VFNRIQIKTSSGAVICNTDDYHILQKLLGNFDPEYESQAHVTADYRGARANNINVAALVEDGLTIQHNY